ncbi:N-acetylmuramoyl-L-alanine amidase [Bacillus horti]|uniref:Autolysin n=1 Tax=Caldalkalibacillus horti TaxID=77523 RepID=A0ABT9VW05_9BACI|nr:peptidoglycan recognition family protein [Bacillus horti]MDQ0165161.1 N-acetyl-anhydromuramyl-L-alanine amidase AmpD [Bacillus horti]
MQIVDIRKDMPRHPNVGLSYRKETDIRSLAIHHSLTTSGSPQAFANYHIHTNGWSIMGYTYVIMRDGTIYWCADHTIVTPHVGNSNRHALGINLVGDFRRGKQQPTVEQRASLSWLIAFLKSTLPNPNFDILGHQEYPGYSRKDCPTNYQDVRAFMDKIRLDSNQFMKLKEAGKMLKLDKPWMYETLAQNLKGLYNAKILNSLEWYEKAKKQKITVDELAWVNNVCLTRHITNK